MKKITCDCSVAESCPQGRTGSGIRCSIWVREDCDRRLDRVLGMPVIVVPDGAPDRAVVVQNNRVVAVIDCSS